MSWRMVEDVLVEALAQFAASLVSPFTLAAVLLAGFLCRRIWPLRLSGLAVGAAWGLLDILTATTRPTVAVALGASSAAGLVQAEIVIAIVLPAWRFGRHVARRIAEELSGLWR